MRTHPAIKTSLAGLVFFTVSVIAVVTPVLASTATVSNQTSHTAHAVISYLGCRGETLTVKPGEKVTFSPLGCLIDKATATVDGKAATPFKMASTRVRTLTIVAVPGGYKVEGAP